MKDLEAKRRREYEERKRSVYVNRRLNCCRRINLKEQILIERIPEYTESYDKLIERAKRAA